MSLGQLADKELPPPVPERPPVPEIFFSAPLPEVATSPKSLEVFARQGSVATRTAGGFSRWPSSRGKNFKPKDHLALGRAGKISAPWPPQT